MVIVDEAHHLAWSDSAQPGYLFVEQLGRISLSLILLTARRSIRQESHFARLRLLDPDRFYSLRLSSEEERYLSRLPTGQVVAGGRSVG